MKFTIAIICSNDHLIEKCIKSIPKDIPIIVVLNYPDDYVLNVVNNNKQIKVYRCDERNLGKLRQLAVEKCKTPAICFIDSDCVLSKNLVKTVEKELKKSYAVNIPLDFDYYNYFTKIVSKCRKYTTPDNLLYMPFAFRIELQDKIGKLFDEKLYWGEDSDQRKRMNQHNITYIISKARVLHKALTFKDDSKSAIRLGQGTFVQEINGYNEKRTLKKDLSIIYEIKEAYNCYKLTKSLGASLYHFFIWRISYKYGYWKERYKYENKHKNNK